MIAGTAPSGTVIDSHYGPDGATLREVRATHPITTVEPAEARQA